MGLDYSFELFYKRCDLEIALLATATITSEKVPVVPITFPDGKQITFPVRTRDGSNSVTLQDGETWLETSLLFPLDQAMAYYKALGHQTEIEKRNGVDYVPLGVRLSINLGQNYCALGFWSTGNSMSVFLFDQSTMIPQMFCDVLTRSNGLAIIYSQQESSMISLLSPNSPEIKDLLTDEAYVWKNDAAESLDVDIYTEALLKAIVKAESATAEIQA